MRRILLPFSFSILILAAGCGGSSGGGGGGPATGPTCLFTSDSCFVASGGTFTAPDLLTMQTACTDSGGTFTQSGTCSTANSVTGYCAIPNGAMAGLLGTTVPGATMQGYYYTAAWDGTTADGDCTAIGGTWLGGSTATCGDGTVSGAEVCDGANLDGQTCVSRGFTGGTLACAGNCLSFNTTACTGGGATTTIRCLWSGIICDQVTGVMTPTQSSSLQSSCTSAGGTAAVGTCSTAGAVSGHCHYSSTYDMTGITIPGGYLDEYYYTASWTAPDAQSYCATPPAGTWVP